LYWSTADDVGVPIVQNAMSRNRYLKLKSVLHFANNDELDPSDKCYKVCPLTEKVNKNFQQWGVFSTNLSIDERIVKYYGHNRLKQFIRGKPIRFGYKFWALCASSGYCFNFSVYTGKSESNNTAGLNLGSKVVINLLECVEVPNDHVLYFDNFFTNRDLSIKFNLKHLGFRATATMTENRTDQQKSYKKNHEGLMIIDLMMKDRFYL
jgi:hypothetical protein